MTSIAQLADRWPFLADLGSHPHLCTIFASGIAAIVQNRGQSAAAAQIRRQIQKIKDATSTRAPSWSETQWSGIDGICLVLIDGFGTCQLNEHWAYTPFLRERKTQLEIGQTIIPSSTAAAIPSATTGELPGKTGMTGWSVRDGDKVVDLLSFRDASFNPTEYQNRPTLFETAQAVGIECAAINSARFAHSGLTLAALRGTRQISAENLSDRIEAAVAQMRRGTPIIYLYWHGLDHAGHVHGVGSAPWCQSLEAVDRAIAQLVARCPKNYSVILTSDHGMVNTTPETRINITEHPALLQHVQLLAGDGRAAHLHAAPGRATQVINRWEDYLEERAWVVPREHLADVLGEGNKLKRIGDALVLMRENWVVADSRTQSDSLLNITGVHGSVSDSERLIPAMRLR